MELFEVDALIDEIMTRWRRPYPRDITDQVFLEIQKNYSSRYENIIAQYDSRVVNQYIGRLVKSITHLETKGRNNKPKSKLIQSYSELG